MTLTAGLRAPRNEENRRKKNNKLIIAVKTFKKSNITTYEYAKCVLFRLKHKRFSNEIHLRIVKFLEFKTEAVCFVFVFDLFPFFITLKINRCNQTQIHMYKKT